MACGAVNFRHPSIKKGPPGLVGPAAIQGRRNETCRDTPEKPIGARPSNRQDCQQMIAYSVPHNRPALRMNCRSCPDSQMR